MTIRRRKTSSEPLRGENCPHCGVRHRKITFDECFDRSMSEKTLQDRIVGRAKRRGFKVAHAGRGIAAFTAEGEPIFVTPMAKGWPDLFLLHERRGFVLVIECKKEKEEPTDEQIGWIRAFNACGIPAVVCKPSDLRLGRVDAILAGK